MEMEKRMKFYKMNGIGNDFIVIDAFHTRVENPSELAKNLCRRGLSVGADGLMLLESTPNADSFMRLYNNDGSEAEMCGNGVRCAAKLTYDLGIARRETVQVETLAGIRSIRLQIENGKAVAATVDMSEPIFDPVKIPVNAPGNEFAVDLDGQTARFFCVSTGTPHAVTFDCFPDGEVFRRFGVKMENHPNFPRKANIDFARVVDRNHVEMRVWERGCGPTLACGTGACAVLTAGVKKGLLDREAEVRLPGGILKIRWEENGHLFMTGPAALSYIGEI